MTVRCASGASIRPRTPGWWQLSHRPHRRGRRRPGAADRRLAGAGGRVVLPGHRVAIPRGWSGARHFTSLGGRLRVLDLEDEFFGEASVSGRAVVNGRELRGVGAARQCPGGEPDRSFGRHHRHHPGRAGRDHSLGPWPVCSWCRAGGGTGKTVVALHRAAYLLYAHRFPLEGQGVLVVGPNRLFLGYIEQVLPSLGEAGVELAVLARPGARASGSRGGTSRRRPGSRATCVWST